MAVKRVAIVCVDRDNDLGRKTGIEGPVIGRKENLRAAAKLALSDPAESDANTMFAAVKKYDEVKDQFEFVEVITLTGAKKFGFESDKKINEQLDSYLDKHEVDAFILITDGAEDDQVIPILQSRAPIYSKEEVIIKQAREVESTFYTIKEALKDPFLSRVVFGIPGIILLLFVALPSIGLQLITLVAGVYLLLKGFGLEEKIVGGIQGFTSSLSLQRVSFPFYLGGLLLAAFGIFSAYPSLVNSAVSFNSSFTLFVSELSSAVDLLVFFFWMAGMLIIAGKIVDLIHLKKAYLLRNSFLSAIAITLISVLLEAGKAVVAGTASLGWFFTQLIGTIIISYVVYRATTVFDIRKKVTKLLVGLPAYNNKGKWIGYVETIDREQGWIELKTKNAAQKVAKNEFIFREGKIWLQ